MLDNLLKIDSQDVSTLKLTFTNHIFCVSFPSSLMQSLSILESVKASASSLCKGSVINDIGESVSNEMIWEEIKQKVLMNDTQLRDENSNETK